MSFRNHQGQGIITSYKHQSFDSYKSDKINHCDVNTHQDADAKVFTGERFSKLRKTYASMRKSFKFKPNLQQTSNEPIKCEQQQQQHFNSTPEGRLKITATKHTHHIKSTTGDAATTTTGAKMCETQTKTVGFVRGVGGRFMSMTRNAKNKPRDIIFGCELKSKIESQLKPITRRQSHSPSSSSHSSSGKLSDADAKIETRLKNSKFKTRPSARWTIQAGNACDDLDFEQLELIKQKELREVLFSGSSLNLRQTKGVLDKQTTSTHCLETATQKHKAEKSNLCLNENIIKDDNNADVGGEYDKRFAGCESHNVAFEECKIVASELKNTNIERTKENKHLKVEFKGRKEGEEFSFNSSSLLVGEKEFEKNSTRALSDVSSSLNSTNPNNSKEQTNVTITYQTTATPTVPMLESAVIQQTGDDQATDQASREKSCNYKQANYKLNVDKDGFCSSPHIHQKSNRDNGKYRRKSQLCRNDEFVSNNDNKDRGSCCLVDSNSNCICRIEEDSSFDFSQQQQTNKKKKPNQNRSLNRRKTMDSRELNDYNLYNKYIQDMKHPNAYNTSWKQTNTDKIDSYNQYHDANLQHYESMDSFDSSVSANNNQFFEHQIDETYSNDLDASDIMFRQRHNMMLFDGRPNNLSKQPTDSDRKPQTSSFFKKLKCFLTSSKKTKSIKNNDIFKFPTQRNNNNYGKSLKSATLSSKSMQDLSKFFDSDRRFLSFEQSNNQQHERLEDENSNTHSNQYRSSTMKSGKNIRKHSRRQLTQQIFWPIEAETSQHHNLYNRRNEVSSQVSIPSSDSGLSVSNTLTNIMNLGRNQNLYSSIEISSVHSNNNKESRKILKEVKPSPKFIGKAKALVDCNPCAYDKEALVFKKGDLINIIEKNESGTWIGSTKDSKIGHFKFINVIELETCQDEYDEADDSSTRESSNISMQQSKETEKSSSSYITKLEIKNGNINSTNNEYQLIENSNKSLLVGNHQGVRKVHDQDSQHHKSDASRSEYSSTPTISALEQLLFAIGLSNDRCLHDYLELFKANGIDDLDSMSRLTGEDELKRIGIDSYEHRCRIMMAAKLLKQASKGMSNQDISASPRSLETRIDKRHDDSSKIFEKNNGRYESTQCVDYNMNLYPRQINFLSDCEYIQKQKQEYEPVYQDILDEYMTYYDSNTRGQNFFPSEIKGNFHSSRYCYPENLDGMMRTYMPPKMSRNSKSAYDLRFDLSQFFA